MSELFHRARMVGKESAPPPAYKSLSLHTHTHFCFHTRIQIHTYAYLHTYIHTYLPTYTHTHAHVYTHVYYTHTHIHTPQWKADNCLSLLSLMTEEDKATFYFDVRHLNWEEYVATFCQGTKYYLLKDDPANLPKARKQIKR